MNKADCCCQKIGEKKYAKEGKVLIQIKGDVITIKPYRLADLRELFDEMEVDVKTDLSNWKSLKRGLLEIR
jgi:hypothetical protein